MQHFSVADEYFWQVLFSLLEDCIVFCLILLGLFRVLSEY